MKSVYLTTSGTSVRRRGDRLEAWLRDKKVSDIRLTELERLIVIGSVQVTAPALILLLERGVDMVLISGQGRLRGSLASVHSKNVFLRMAQFQRWQDDAFRRDFGCQVLMAKLAAQDRLLARYQRNHPNALDATARARIQSCLGKLQQAQTVDELQGLEGTAAAAYFSQLDPMLQHIGFSGRKKHPPPDPVNALLSLGYVLLTREIAALLETKGLDPAVGLVHGLRYGRQSLALDVVEPFRQPIIDRLTLRLFNRRQFTADDFEGSDKGMRLGGDGLKEYLRHYEAQLDGVSEGKDSPTWRRRLRLQVDAVRRMILEKTIEPFDTWSG